MFNKMHNDMDLNCGTIAEALAQAVPGFRRADEPEGSTMGIFLQVIDPQAFGWLNDVTRQSQWLVDACHANTPLPGGPRVRMPGEHALVRLRQAVEEGAPLVPENFDALAPLMVAAGLKWPAAMGD